MSVSTSMLEKTALCREAQKALNASPFYDLRELTVEELSDRRLVGSFYHKQLAQEVILAMAKGKAYRVINEIEVVDTLSN